MCIAAVNPLTLWSSFEATLRSGMPHHYLISRMVELTTISVFITSLVLLFLKYLGFCRYVRNARRMMVAELLSLSLFYGNPRLLIRHELRLVIANLWLLLMLTPTLLFGSILFGLFFNTLHERYGHDVLPLGKAVVVQVRTLDNTKLDSKSRELRSLSSKLKVEAVARIPEQHTNWSRLRSDHPGIFGVEIGITNPMMLDLNFARPDRPPFPFRSHNGLEISVAYPPASYWGFEYGWLLYLIIVSLISALPLSRLLRVDI